MSSNNTQPKLDHWSSEAYSSAAGFVPKLTTTVFSYLDPQPTDNILDLGCGDGELTVKISEACSQGQVLGVDASPSFIRTANELYLKDGFGNLTFALHDATQLETCRELGTGEVWDKIFSNAALHWILRKPAIRKGFFDIVFKALRPGGSFVFEMGGAGNVAEMHIAAIAALVHVGGVSLKEAREASPWCFSSVDGMTKMLEGAGFEVEKCEIEYRPTKLSPKMDDGSGGLEGWVKMMCGQFVEVVKDQEKREKVLEEIVSLAESIVTREDGSQWLGYVRLRAVAKKSSEID